MERLYHKNSTTELIPTTLIVPLCIPDTQLYPESLASFIIRLSKVHHVSVGRIFSLFIQPRMSSLQKGHILHRCTDGYSINGAGGLGLDVFQVVNVLTRPSDHFRFCSFYFLSSLLGKSYKNLLSKKLKWCPQCITEIQQSYYPLYWHSLNVDCCIKHQTKLVSVCPSCKGPQMLLTASSVMGECADCGKPLCKSYENFNEIKAAARELWVAENINQLVINHKYLSKIDTLKNFRENLKLICTDYGSITKAEYRLGFSETLFQRWLTRNHPNMPELIELGYRLNIPLISFLLPHGIKNRSRACYLYPKKKPQVKLAAQKDEIEKRLLQIIEKNEIISIKSLAKELGKSEGFLQYQFRELLDEIITIRNRHVAQERAVNRDKLIADTAEIAIQLMIQGKYFGGRMMTSSLSDKVGFKKMTNRSLIEVFNNEKLKYSELLAIALRDKLSPSNRMEK